ncbi:MAG: hypothetical protein WKF94_01640 [Solirubrobacteraceae bacterium]
MLIGATVLLAGCGGADAEPRPEPPPKLSSGIASAEDAEDAEDADGVLARADLLDGRQLELRGTDSGLCLVLSGLDEYDRQCGVAPSERVPESRRVLFTGPIAQRGRHAPLEVYGETSATVDDVRIRYSYGGRRYAHLATMLYATDRNALRQAGIARPFNYFVAELPAQARRVTATALDRRSRPIARDDYRDFHDLERKVFIAATGEKPLPMIRVRRVIQRVDKIQVPVRIRRKIGVRDGVSRSYFVSTDSPRPQVGCVTLRSAYIEKGSIGTTVRPTLDEADGEGGGSGWCPGPYLGTVVYAVSGVCPRRGLCENASPIPRRGELIARFAYRVR